MARIARVVVPGFPYHVTHRGNRRAQVFFSDEDRHLYLAYLAEQSERAEDYAWSSCREHVALRAMANVMAAGSPFTGHVGAQQWCGWINSGVDAGFANRIRKETMSGRPCGGSDFVKDMELRLGSILQTPPMGRPRKATTPEALMEDLFA